MKGPDYLGVIKELRAVKKGSSCAGWKHDNAISYSNNEKIRADNLQAELTRQREATGKVHQEVGSLKAQLNIAKTEKEWPR